MWNVSASVPIGLYAIDPPGDLTVTDLVAVDPPEPLDDPHRIPVNVVVHQKIAVLEVLAFRDAVCGDQDINLAQLIRHDRRLLLGAGREQREQGLEIIALTQRRFGGI